MQRILKLHIWSHGNYPASHYSSFDIQTVSTLFIRDVKLIFAVQEAGIYIACFYSVVQSHTTYQAAEVFIQLSLDITPEHRRSAEAMGTCSRC